ncbi:MAG: acyl-CoA reductase, partial [Cyclobacteriaceae bacterium]
RVLFRSISVVYYERYSDQQDLKKRLSNHKEKVQCILSAKAWYEQGVDFGKAQMPEAWDYADNVDTLKFLAELD